MANMRYVTFHAADNAWKLFDGIGVDGLLMGQRSNPPPLIDLGAGSEPALWSCCSTDTPGKSLIERVRLPELVVDRVITMEGRLVALAASGDGQQIAVLKLPSDSGEFSSLWIWNGQDWRQIHSDVRPDISSRLAWIDSRHIAFESFTRHISVLDLKTGTVETGPAGCCPAAAPDIGRWYAVSDGRVVAFDVDREIGSAIADPAGIRLRQVTSLRVTRDGEVFTLTKPRFWFGSKTVIQQRGRRRISHRKLQDGFLVVLGPYDF